MTSPARQLADLRRGRRIVLHAQRVKSAPHDLCYRCTRQRDYRYPLQPPGYLFAYEPPDEGAPTDVLICADCLRDICDLLAKWILKR